MAAIRFLTLIVSLPGATQAAERPESVAVVERAAIQQRERIRRDVVHLHSIVRFTDGSRPARDRKVSVYLDGQRIRGDFLVPYDDDSPVDEDRYRESKSFTDGRYLFYSDQQFDDGGHMATTIGSIDDLRPNEDAIPDPRLIGMCPTTFNNLVNCHLNTIIANPSYRVSDGPISESRNGYPAKKVTYRRDDQPEWVADIWFAHEHDFNPVAIEAACFGIREAIDCELGIVEGVGWFPVSAHYQRWQNDALVKEERLEVGVEQFNGEIESSEFELLAMGAPVGTTIHDMTTRGGKLWTLTQHGLEEYIRPPSPVDARERRHLRWILIANAFVLAIVTALLLVRRTARK